MNRKNATADPGAGLQPVPYFGTLVLGWLVPGLGHFLLGYRLRGLLIAVALVGTFWIGEKVLGEGLAVSREVHPVFFGLQAGNGLSAIAAELIHGKPAHPDANQTTRIIEMPEHVNLGILFCSVSGLLNALVVLYLADPRTWQYALSRRPAGVPVRPGS
jgi:hypothetical protein